MGSRRNETLQCRSDCRENKQKVQTTFSERLRFCIQALADKKDVVMDGDCLALVLPAVHQPENET